MTGRPVTQSLGEFSPISCSWWGGLHHFKEDTAAVQGHFKAICTIWFNIPCVLVCVFVTTYPTVPFVICSTVVVVVVVIITYKKHEYHPTFLWCHHIDFPLIHGRTHTIQQFNTNPTHLFSLGPEWNIFTIFPVLSLVRSPGDWSHAYISHVRPEAIHRKMCVLQREEGVIRGSVLDWDVD